MCQTLACQLQVGVIVIIVPLWVGAIEVGGQLSIYQQDSPVKSDWFGQRLKGLNLLCKQFCPCFEMEGTLPHDGVRLSEGSGQKQTNNQHQMTTVVSGGLPLRFWYQTSSRCIVHTFG